MCLLVADQRDDVHSFAESAVVRCRQYSKIYLPWCFLRNIARRVREVMKCTTVVLQGIGGMCQYIAGILIHRINAHVQTVVLRLVTYRTLCLQ